MNKPVNNIFDTSPCLSHAELSNYHLGKLSNKATHRVEEHLVDCDLCSQALAGIALVPVSEADMNDLHRQIDLRVQKGGGGMWSTKVIVASITAIAAVGTILFYSNVFTDPQTPAVPEKLLAENEVGVKEDVKMPVVAEVPVTPVPEDITDKGVVTKKAKVIFPKENFTENKAAVPEVKKADEPAINSTEKNPLNAPHINSADIKPIPEPEEPVVNQEYNAPVRYIYDMKVTDYERFYFKEITEFSKPGTNVAPQFESRLNKNMEGDNLERTIKSTDILNKGLMYFKDENFRRANEQFALLIDLNKNDVNALFYSAIAHYRLDKNDRCIEYLDRVLLSPNNVFHPESQWYKALALLKKKENEKAREVLNEIVKSKGFYAKQAKEKLKTI